MDGRSRRHGNADISRLKCRSANSILGITFSGGTVSCSSDVSADTGPADTIRYRDIADTVVEGENSPSAGGRDVGAVVDGDVAEDGCRRPRSSVVAGFDTSRFIARRS